MNNTKTIYDLFLEQKIKCALFVSSLKHLSKTNAQFLSQNFPTLKLSKTTMAGYAYFTQAGILTFRCQNI